MEVGQETVPTNTNAAEAFGYEVDNSTTVETNPTANTVDPQQLINDTIKTLDTDDKGKFIYPDDMDPMLKAAIQATKSFRDTQSSFTKGQQELKASNAELEALRAQLVKNEDPLAGLSQEERTALTELKYTNPDEWYKRMQALERSTATRVEEKFAEVTKEAKAKTAEEQRIIALEEFNKTAENKLTQEQLENDVPPSWIKQVVSGEISFEKFLERSSKLLYGDKTVDNPDVDLATNLNAQTGGGKDPQVEEGINYANVTF